MEITGCPATAESYHPLIVEAWKLLGNDWPILELGTPDLDFVRIEWAAW
jgi:hypothetical protein